MGIFGTTIELTSNMFAAYLDWEKTKIANLRESQGYKVKIERLFNKVYVTASKGNPVFGEFVSLSNCFTELYDGTIMHTFEAHFSKDQNPKEYHKRVEDFLGRNYSRYNNSKNGFLSKTGEIICISSWSGKTLEVIVYDRNHNHNNPKAGFLY